MAQLDDAYKVIDADKMIVRQIFSIEQLSETLQFWKECGEYGSVSVDVDGDIICYEAEDENDQ